LEKRLEKWQIVGKSSKKAGESGKSGKMLVKIKNSWKKVGKLLEKVAKSW
jgi:hypothetical protein